MPLMRKDTRPAARRRGNTLEDVLLSAAWAELGTNGYTKLTMDAVALRAETSKTVLYRRWPSRAELVLAALGKFAPMNNTVPNTGTLRGDVLELLRRLSKRYEQYPEILQGLMKELPEAKTKVTQVAMKEILVFARERGEISGKSIPDRVAFLPFHLVIYEMSATRSPLKKKALMQIVDEIFLPLLKARLLLGPKRNLK
jgi:AcrR family transcriptional regulator